MSTEEVVRLKNPVTERDHFMGREDGVVTLLEYGNFECVVDAYFQLSNRCKKFLVIICALSSGIFPA